MIRGVLQSGFRAYLTTKAVLRILLRTIQFIPLSEEERTKLETAWSRIFKMSIRSVDVRRPEQVRGS